MIAAALDGIGLIDTAAGPLRLSRAWPRGEGLLHLEYRDGAGHAVAAQWVRDAEDLVRMALAAGAGAELRAGQSLLLHWAGADSRLPALRACLAAGGAELVSHRPGRHAVVRRADGSYLKVVRPGRSGGVVSASEQAVVQAAGRFDVPVVLGHDPGAGVVVWAGLAGPTLLELAQARPPDEVLASAWTAAGRAVSSLHDASFDGLPVHDAEAEAATAERWVTAAVTWGLLSPVDRNAAYGSLLAGPPGPLGTLHRDLHDKQVVVGRRTGLLDLDTLAVGERALDLANVLAHLALRLDQGLMSPGQVDVARSAFLAGTAPDPATLERIPAHVRVARLRLAGVYAFRPRWRGLARRWLDMATAAAPP